MNIEGRKLWWSEITKITNRSDHMPTFTRIDTTNMIGMLVRACALGQASAALMARHAIGKSVGELVEARDALTAWLAGERDDPPDWPGLDVFVPALAVTARHPSIRLAFEAAAEAAGGARG